MTKPSRKPAAPRQTKRQRRDEAFRVRAGAIGLLTCCTCGYPLHPAPTSTGHAETCQAHGMTLSAMATGRHWSIAWTKSAKEPR